VGHPYPWSGRLALWLTVCWLVLATTKFVAPRASIGSVTLACWSLYAVFALFLAAWLPSASFLAVLPILGFLFGMMLDGLRWNKLPRLSIASFMGFLAAVYLGFYFYFMLELAVSLAHAYLLVVALALPAIAAVPLLLGAVDQRRPRRTAPIVLLVLIAAATIGQSFIPGFTADLPRAMNLVYRGVAGASTAWMVLESPTSEADMPYARRQGFTTVSLVSSAGQPREELARPEPVLALPEVKLTQVETLPSAGSGAAATPARYRLLLDVPADVQQLLLVAAGENHWFAQVLVDGQVVFDQAVPAGGAKGRQTSGTGPRISVQGPEPGPLRLDFLLPGEPQPFELRIRSRFALPDERLQTLLEDWPATAQPAFSGHRAELDQVFTITP
jgi:hypothetical protein